jgi:hypothetical protein
LFRAFPTSDTDRVPNLIDTLATELERPRELSPRVLNYICDKYSLDEEAVGAFLVEQLSGLEDDDVDLILSPVFTPKLADQSIFAELLGRESIPREQWPALIQELAARPTRAQLLTPDRRRHLVTLREVTIERYVHRLRLEATIPDSLFSVIERTLPSPDRPMLKALARRAVWESEGVRNILISYIQAATAQGSYDLADALALLDLVETRKPADVADLLARIPAWQEALRQQIDAGGGKPFFSQNVEAMHGGGRDQRQKDDSRLSAKQTEFEFLHRLQQLLGSSGS